MGLIDSQLFLQIIPFKYIIFKFIKILLTRVVVFYMQQKYIFVSYFDILNFKI